MLYIVHIAVDNDRNEEWFRYMRDEHLQDVLDTGCFYDVTMVRDPDADTAQRTAYRMLYRACSAAAYEQYRAEHAADLQADHTARFGDCIRADRELLPIIVQLVADLDT